MLSNRQIYDSGGPESPGATATSCVAALVGQGEAKRRRGRRGGGGGSGDESRDKAGYTKLQLTHNGLFVFGDKGRRDKARVAEESFITNPGVPAAADLVDTTHPDAAIRVPLAKIDEIEEFRKYNLSLLLARFCSHLARV